MAFCLYESVKFFIKSQLKQRFAISNHYLRKVYNGMKKTRMQKQRMAKSILHTKNCLMRRLSVSCLAKILFFPSSPLGFSKKFWSRYPLSAKAFSVRWRLSTKASRGTRKARIDYNWPTASVDIEQIFAKEI